MAKVYRSQVTAAKLRAMVQTSLGREMYRRGKRVEARAKRGARVDTGRGRASLTTELITRGGLPIARVGTDVQHMVWQYRGTGIYGPRHMRITPVRAKVLRFKPKGSANWVFARSVSGVKPDDSLKDALRAART